MRKKYPGHADVSVRSIHSIRGVNGVVYDQRRYMERGKGSAVGDTNMRAVGARTDHEITTLIQ